MGSAAISDANACAAPVFLTRGPICAAAARGGRGRPGVRDGPPRQWGAGGVPPTPRCPCQSPGGGVGGVPAVFRLLPSPDYHPPGDGDGGHGGVPSSCPLPRKVSPVGSVTAGGALAMCPGAGVLWGSPPCTGSHKVPRAPWGVQLARYPLAVATVSHRMGRGGCAHPCARGVPGCPWPWCTVLPSVPSRSQQLTEPWGRSCWVPVSPPGPPVPLQPSGSGQGVGGQSWGLGWAPGGWTEVVGSDAALGAQIRHRAQLQRRDGDRVGQWNGDRVAQ